MSLRLVLHTGHDGEPGVEAWAIDWLGLATWADTRYAVLARLPEKLGAHCTLLARHGIHALGPEGEIVVVESLEGDEILYFWDREPSSPDEIGYALRLMEATRAELTAFIETATPGALDWDPPYRRFAKWADWRTVRAILAHIANAETHYYTRNIGFAPPFDPASADGDWREFLPRHRDAVVGFLESVATSDDLARLRTTAQGEQWSARKCLRRIVRHEIQHTRSIERILRVYEERAGDPTGGQRQFSASAPPARGSRRPTPTPRATRARKRANEAQLGSSRMRGPSRTIDETLQKRFGSSAGVTLPC